MSLAAMPRRMGVMLAPQLKQWESEGRYLTTVLFQHKVFCKDCGNPTAPPDRTLLLLHGFPESSFSFHKVLKELAKLFDHVVLFDFPGYGLSDKPIANYTHSLFEQADVALQVWKERGVTGGRVLSHDTGDSVHTELVASGPVAEGQNLPLPYRRHPSLANWHACSGRCLTATGRSKQRATEMDRTALSILGDASALAEPMDDQIGDLKVVLFHHHHVAVPFYAESRVHGPLDAVDGGDRFVAELAALIIVRAGRAFVAEHDE